MLPNFVLLTNCQNHIKVRRGGEMNPELTNNCPKAEWIHFWKITWYSKNLKLKSFCIIQLHNTLFLNTFSTFYKIKNYFNYPALEKTLFSNTITAFTEKWLYANIFHITTIHHSHCNTSLLTKCNVEMNIPSSWHFFLTSYLTF